MAEVDIAELRREYAGGDLDVGTVDPSPYRQFAIWFEQATKAELLEPNAMVLSTVSKDGQPTQRTVLLKYFDETGLVFFTNYQSRKAAQMAENAQVSVIFPWLALERQVEINGTVSKVSIAESVRYFARRPRESQLGAWVSQQSSVVTSRSLLLAKLEEMRQKFAAGEVPLPSFWGGFRIAPMRFEFWQGRPSRLHDRIEYLPDGQGGWMRQRLAP